MRMSNNEKDRFFAADLRDAIKSAVSFFDIFDRPLLVEEIKKYAEESGFDAAGIELMIKGIRGIELEGEYVHLKGRDGLIEKYEKYAELNRKYGKKVKFFVPFLKYIPFIKAVAVCNTLSFGSADEESDIDLFIITEKGRIFTARILSALLFQMMGVRRHGEKIKNRFCLSFYVAGSDFDMSRIALDKDVYLHFWGRFLDPVFGRGIMREFISNNGLYLNICKIDEKKYGDERGDVEKKRTAVILERMLNGRIGEGMERLLKNWHLKRLRGRRDLTSETSGVKISDEILKFHNRDRRREYAEAFWLRYNTLD